jgi:glycosyltransferase 2 family protein
MRESSVARKRLTAALKVAVSAALLGYLLHKATRDDSFQQLREQPKNWALLAAALVVELAAVVVTIVRWRMLVAAVAIPFSLREAFRLGFLGFLLNFFTLGTVGGDAIRAVFLARNNPGRGAVAVATVVVDRLIGLFALFLLVSIAFLAIDWNTLEARDPQGLAIIRNLCWAALLGTAAGLAALAVLLLPGFTTSPAWDFLAGLPKVGRTIADLIEALRMYRQRLAVLAVAVAMSLAVHGLLAIGVFLIAQGLPGETPGFGAHLVISPMASAFGAIPLPGGLGAFEVALDFLYRCISAERVSESQGFVIALAYRVITILIAGIGAGYYVSSRREVRRLMKEAAKEQMT